MRFVKRRLPVAPALALTALLMSSCDNTDQGQASVVPVKTERPTSLVDTCGSYAEVVSTKCGFDKGDAEGQCLVFHRLGRAANCENIIEAALKCVQESAEKRATPSTTECGEPRCDKYDRQLENCLKTHCDDNGTDRDCVDLFGGAK